MLKGGTLCSLRTNLGDSQNLQMSLIPQTNFLVRTFFSISYSRLYHKLYNSQYQLHSLLILQSKILLLWNKKISNFEPKSTFLAINFTKKPVEKKNRLFYHFHVHIGYSRTSFRTEIGCVLITKQNLRKFEFLKVHSRKIQNFKILLGDMNATSLCSKDISALMDTLTPTHALNIHT